MGDAERAMLAVAVPVLGDFSRDKESGARWDAAEFISPRGRGRAAGCRCVRVARGFDQLSGARLPPLMKAFPDAGAIFSFPVLSCCSFIS